MIINIITINRPETRHAAKNYIDNTLKFLTESDWNETNIPVNLLVGSTNEAYLEPYRDRFNIVPWDQESKKLTRDFDVNYLRSLKYQPDDDLLLCEDDVRLSKSWYKKLTAAIQEIPQKRYVMSLYSPTDFGHKVYNRGKYYRSYAADRFYGTQSIYYPAHIRKEAANFLEKHMKGTEWPKPADVILNSFFRNNDFLYLTNPTLVQHIGKQTTGLGTFHSAWNFNPE